jgi:hypothetical protein
MPKAAKASSTKTHAPGSDYPLDTRVEVTWVDSASASGGHWTDLDGFRKEGGTVVVSTVGYLVDASDDQVRIVSSQSRVQDGSGVFGALSIPRVAVLALTHL